MAIVLDNRELVLSGGENSLNLKIFEKLLDDPQYSIKNLNSTVVVSKDYEGKSPYPKGEERELINKKFESLLDIVRESQDFVFKELEEEQNKRKANKTKHKVKEKDIEILM